MSRGPLVRVLEVSTYRLPSSPLNGMTAELRLACGHVVRRKFSEAGVSRVRCRACLTGEPRDPAWGPVLEAYRGLERAGKLL